MKRYPRITVFKDVAGGWRWRMVAGGRVVAESGEAYSERNKCVRAIESVFNIDHGDVVRAARTGGAAYAWPNETRIRIEGKR